METRANFVVIGAFTLAMVVAAFLFVMWIAGYASTGTHRHYRIVFNGSVSGLSNGALVLFNGLKVGEVTGLDFVKGDPSQVFADIDVTNASAPINSGTKAQLETQGLTGSATVALIGGEKEAPDLTGNPPVIPSLPTATLADLQTKAGYVLDLANKLLVDNAQPIHQTIENVQTFSMALSNNSAGLDAALKGLGDLGKTIQPLASRLQILSDDADKLVVAIEPAKVRSIVDNVQSVSARAGSVLDRADKLLG
jgi:phospholipid/cholesterol/gamma-HCH transport system substrate-binding protein